jgi:LAS superfamily LD-carboxypeptidase LdcB
MSGKETRACECRQPDCFACELAGTKEWLAEHGLAIVRAEDARVLKAMAKVPKKILVNSLVASGYPSSASDNEVAEAELARRAAKKARGE